MNKFDNYQRLYTLKEITKALLDGKKVYKQPHLRKDDNDYSYYEMKDNFLFLTGKDDETLNADLCFLPQVYKYYTEKNFTIEVGKRYKTRCGKSAVCVYQFEKNYSGQKTFEICVIGEHPSRNSYLVYGNGKLYLEGYSELDIVDELGD